MRNKVLIVTLVAVLLFSFLNLASASFQCPKCHGSGFLTTSDTCPTCKGAYVADARVTLKRTFAWASESATGPATSVSGVFRNEEDVGVYGAATAQVKTSTATYTNTSAKTYFPPHEDVTVTLVVDGIAYEQYLSCSIYLSEIEGIDCPDCDGTGVVFITVVCPECGGTGFVAALPQDETNSLVVGAVVAGVAIAVLLVIVVMARRKRVTEESLRRLPSSEFQNWVLQRLSGRVASQKDSNIGIHGYTIEGYPFQAKQSEDVGRNEVDSFASLVGRSRARTGVIVAFSFGKGTFEGVIRARLNYGFEIKTVTVKELIESKGRTY